MFDDYLIKQLGYDHVKTSTKKLYNKLVDIHEGRYQPILTSLDAEREAFNGFYPSDQIVIPARSGMGKSAKLISLIDDFTNLNINYLWKDKLILLYDSFEMVDWRNVLRMLSRELNLPIKQILTTYASNLNNERQEKIKILSRGINNRPIYISRNYPNVLQWEQTKSKICESYPNHTIINLVDHTRLITKSTENKEEELITGLMNAGMRIKKKYECINIFLSQLNRNIETDTSGSKLGKRLPIASDIFGSDAVFQTADIVMALHRPGYYGLQEFELNGKLYPTGLSMSSKTDNLMIQSILKNRDGDTPNIVVKHDLSINKFYNYKNAA